MFHRFMNAWSLVFSDLLDSTGLKRSIKIHERRLTCLNEATQKPFKLVYLWTGLPDATTTCEDYHVLRLRFPYLMQQHAWGHDASSAGGSVISQCPGAVRAWHRHSARRRERLKEAQLRCAGRTRVYGPSAQLYDGKYRVYKPVWEGSWASR
jgi:hypothetical protein